MIGRVAYALLFCVVLPFLLWEWSRSVHLGLAIPLLQSAVIGWPVAALGAALMAWGMLSLWRFGGGLPMNAFPPTRRVSSGAFALVGHPIYVGFVLLCGGFFLATGSKVGLWLVTPIVALACTALVQGYERHDMAHRLGPPLATPWLCLAEPTDKPPPLRDRLAAAALILVPWLAIYEAIGHVHTDHVVQTWTALDLSWRVVPATEAIYMLAYPMVIAAPFLVPTGRSLRRFELAGLAAMAVAFWSYLSLPLVTLPKEFADEGWAASLLALERLDGLDGRAAFPSFHVCWVMLAAVAIGDRGRAWSAVAWTLAIAITASCVTTGMHGLVDVAGGVGLFLISHYHGRVWRWLLLSSEAIANTWREWRIGGVRVLMHAVYAGLATGAGLLICGLLLDDAWIAPLVWVAIGALVGAGVWGQVFEASGKLSRPFGYYGHVVGTTISLAVIWWLQGACWPLIAALAAAAPWSQAIGRLRCLVQGCCHGREVVGAEGITYHEARSRVCRLSELGHRTIHATQLYSIVWNVAIGGPLLRLWSAQADASMIVGMYLMLSGLGRFVEEAYRGEPQTAIIAGLRAYQWLAILCIVGGAVVTCIGSGAVEIGGAITGELLICTAIVSLLYAGAMGVDFPASNRRLARLA